MGYDEENVTGGLRAEKRPKSSELELSAGADNGQEMGRDPVITVEGEEEGELQGSTESLQLVELCGNDDLRDSSPLLTNFSDRRMSIARDWRLPDVNLSVTESL